ncbi:cyclic nucleotide-binding domain-containing protein [Phreatobacter sp.]|uniref:cyclic nucleotide-binding domain-containing protein n=1 Tax=Phreatobacter sp. TaxID=1966341 RepID=UPI003F6F1907
MEVALLRTDDIQTVRSLPLFAEISESHFGALMRAAFLQRFPAQTLLIHEGDQADFLHVIVEGMVEMFSNSDGEETTIGFLEPVSTFILAAVLVEKVYLQSARTLGPSRILMIPAQAIRDVFARDPAFAGSVVRELAERYRDVVRQLKSQKMRSGLERLAAWMLERGIRRGETLEVHIPFEKAKLASFLGMTRESLSRSFAALADHDVMVRGRVITCNRSDALARLARTLGSSDSS